MTRLGALFLLLAACERPASKLDTNGELAVQGGAYEERLRRLEQNLAKREEALQFLEQQYAAQKAEAEARAAEEPAEDAIFAVDIGADLEAGLVEGPASAPVTIVKAFDFACPYCQQANDTLEELVAEYGGKIRIVYKNFIIHDTAMPAHLASCAAAKQHKYVELKNALWDRAFQPYIDSNGRNGASMGKDNILKIAGDLGLDTKQLDADMSSEACKAIIDADAKELEKFHVSSTPTLFVNGTHVGGAIPKKAFEKLIDDKLALAAQSGVSGADYYAKEVFAKGEKQFRSKNQPKP